MSGLFGGGSQQRMPEPKVVRAPTEQDPDVLERMRRRRELARQRSGRQSTILSENTRAMTGSSGTKLGA